MVWAGISLGYRTDLHIFKRGSVTIVRYQDEILEPIVRLYAAVVDTTFVLMDDNARPHRADIVEDYLESEGIARPNTKFKYLLSTTGPFEASTDQKWPELANRRDVVFHQDTARPQTSVVTRYKFWELDWKVLMHPPYSPDLTPNVYHLFLALQNCQSDKKLG
ncbi:transposable element Tcb1 transposase [Trichonephila clavipes]|nr:transposable element Tcb1 transposase [Trichonephila clavipes]